jgi:uncharacterized protein
MIKSRIRTGRVVFLILLFLIIGIVIGRFLISGLGNINAQQKSNIGNANTDNNGITVIDTSAINPEATYSSMKIPAIDSNGNGVSTNLVVEVMPGSGRTLMDIDNLLFWGDTQSSIRTAKDVAFNYTKKDPNKYDIIYHVNANASVIGGPSAGAALTIVTIAALQNKQLKNDVMITGSINHDGSIGPVGEITGKAKVAKADNSSLFLVPLLQSKEITYQDQKYCKNFGLTEFCTIEQIPTQVNVQESSGIQVKEVGNIEEALNYFYQ